MTYISFEKEKLINLEYSLSREILRTNRAGSYSSSTIIGVNTRKYHGLLVCPVRELDGGKHVFLSTLDETLIQHNSEFNLGMHKYPGNQYSPKGHKYIRDLEFGNLPKITFRIGGMVFTKESLLVRNRTQLLIRYTLVDAHSETTLRLRPFLAFRNIHNVSKENFDVNTKVTKITNGVSSRLYEGYPHLHMQFSKEVEFVVGPHWNKNIEYTKEEERGYDFHEDLFVPGYFEMPIKKGETIIFSASLDEMKPYAFKRIFTTEHNKRISRDSFADVLVNASEQFINRYVNGTTELIAGYHWHDSIDRDTFISLPWLTLTKGDATTFLKIFESKINAYNQKILQKKNLTEENADTPLWLIWCLQQYWNSSFSKLNPWKKYSGTLKAILKHYKSTADRHVHMGDNNLIYAKKDGVALTWMNSYAYGKPVNPRPGFSVEINALWYNAVRFCLELSELANDTEFIEQWKFLPEKIAENFYSSFWSDELKYLADYTDGDFKDFSVRPNQIIAAGLPYSPLQKEQIKAVTDKVKTELLVNMGLRSLSPKNMLYKGMSFGSQDERVTAFHNGAVHPWLTSFFAEAYLLIYKTSGLPFLKSLTDNFEEEIRNHCIGSVSEIYDGAPPFIGRGAISKAVSVGSVLNLIDLIGKYNLSEV